MFDMDEDGYLSFDLPPDVRLSVGVHVTDQITVVACRLPTLLLVTSGDLKPYLSLPLPYMTGVVDGRKVRWLHHHQSLRLATAGFMNRAQLIDC